MHGFQYVTNQLCESQYATWSPTWERCWLQSSSAHPNDEDLEVAWSQNLIDANLNRHALRPNKQYWNNCPRKLKFIFWWNPDLSFISEMRTKGISNRPWPNDYNGIMNRRYKVWTLQGRIPDKFTILEEPKEEQSLTFSDFYSIVSLLQWVHATYKT